MAIIEVIGTGFDGSTDDTDDRVLWVEAPSLDYVKNMLLSTPYSGANELNLHVCPDYIMPRDTVAFIEKLRSFEEVK